MTRRFAGIPFDIPPSCDDCGKPEAECGCSAVEKAARPAARQREADRLVPGEQTATVAVERRNGKRTVTVVKGLTARANDLGDLLSQLQSVCGTGGTVKPKQDVIELQGDHADSARRLIPRDVKGLLVIPRRRRELGVQSR